MGLGLALGWATQASAADAPWIEGTHYFRVDPSRVPPSPAGKTTVTEVFSYGCPACNAFVPYMRALKASLPPGTLVEYLPASFVPSEDWPMFQRAYLTAQILGVADRTHEAAFSAVWKSGELATMDPATHGLRKPMPTIEDAAAFYNRVAGVPTTQFLEAARSFSTELNMKKSDDLIKAYQADSTPTLIINGKYRISGREAGGFQPMIDIAKWLIAKESR
jgi:thiol:disulfide interchange protein DsbA